MKNFDEKEWGRTRSLLREHLRAPRLEHPDFVNSRVLQEIERLKRAPRPSALFPLKWLAWTGVAAIFCAGLLTMLFLPHDTGRRSDTEFISQVVSARAEIPQLSVSEFRVPNERGVVIWLEGADYIPAENAVR
jgi:hypothetical protein